MKGINSSKVISIICYGISAFIFLVIFLLGVYLHSGDEMGYCVLCFYMIMPFTALIGSLIISMKRGYLFWVYPIFAGLFGLIIPFLVFRTFDLGGLFFAFFPALVGLAIALIIRSVEHKL